MARNPIPNLNWKGLFFGDLALGLTPPARLEYLVALNARITAACLGPYAMTAWGAYLERGADGVRGFQRVNCATLALRPFVVRMAAIDLKGVDPDDTSIFAASSGASSADEILVPSPFDAGSEQWPPDYGETASVRGSQFFQASPVAAMERLLESPTDDSLTGAVTEKLTVKRGLGLSLIPVLVGDLNEIS